MTPLQRMGASAVAAAAALVLGALPAGAAPTASAVLDCGDASYTVTGFGRGQVLLVVDSTSRFIPTSVDGQRLSAAPGPAGAGALVTCTVTVPDSGRLLVFEGFFTPVS